MLWHCPKGNKATADILVKNDIRVIFFLFYSSQAYLWAPCWSSEPHSDFIFLQEEGKQTALFLFGWCWVFLMLQKITSVPFLGTNVQICYLPVLTQLNKLNCCGQCWLSLNVPQLSFSSFSHHPGYHLLIFSIAPTLFGVWSPDTFTSAEFVVCMILGASIVEAACFAWLFLKDFCVLFVISVTWSMVLTLKTQPFFALQSNPELNYLCNWWWIPSVHFSAVSPVAVFSLFYFISMLLDNCIAPAQ